MWEMLIRVWVLLDVEATRKMDVLSRKKTWESWPLKRNKASNKIHLLYLDVFDSVSSQDDRLARKPLKEHIWRKIKASGQRKMLQRLHLLFLPWSESSAPPGKFLLSAPPSHSLHFALLLLMFVMTLQPEPKRPVEIQGKQKKSERERDWDRRQEKGVFKKQEIEVYQKSLSE